MYPIEKHLLENGLRVLFSSQMPQPVVAIQIWVGVGSSFEPRALSGISHFIEHLVFKGTKNYNSRELNHTVEHAGGILNAFTTLDTTGFHITLPSSQLELGLGILAEMVQRPLFKKNDLETELQVILEELSEEIDNPEAVLGQKLFSLVYGDDPYSRPIIGNRRSLNNLRQSHLINYFNQYYVPNNMVIAIAGNFDTEQAMRLVRKLFNRQPGDIQHAPRTFSMKQRSFQQAWLKMGDEQCAMEMALPTPAIHHPHLIGLDLLSEILAGSEYSKLYQQLYDKQKLVRAVDSYCFTARRSGLFVIRAVLSNGDFSAVTREICNQLSVLRNKKVSDKELRLAKAALKNGLLFEYETADSVAQNLAFYETMFHDPHWPQRHLRTLEDFSSRDLQNLAQLYFRPECISFAGLIPKKQKLKVTQKQIQQILQRHLKTTLTHPPVKQLTSNRKAVATSYKFKENFQLILKSIPQTSIATIFLTIPGGLLLENQNNNGIGNLALSLLNKTNYHKNEQQISLQLTELGADFDVAVGRSNIGLRMDLPAENFEAGLKEFFSLILRPEFNQTIFNRERNFIQQELAGLKDNYEIDCFNYFLSTLFPDHSYGLNPLGKQSALKRLNAQKLKEWYLKQQLTLPWTLTIVSSQSDPQVLKMLRKFSNRLPKLKTFQHQRITDKTLTNRRYEKNIPGHKAYYCYGFKTPGLLPKVWPAVEVLTAVLTSYGGGLLYERLRDKLGLAYTVQSYAYHAHEGGYMAIYVNTAPENLLQVERETVKLFHRLRKNGISLTEINRAKNFLTGSYEIDLQRTSSQAMQLAINYQNGHGCNLSSYQKAVNKVSMQDIRFCLENFITESLAVTAIHSPTV